jgi:type III restriction enzyme
VSDHRYIAELRTALKKEGLIDDDEITKELKLKAEFKKTEFYRTGIIYKNEAVEKDKRKIQSLADLGVKSKNITYLIHSGAGKDTVVFGDPVSENRAGVKTKDISLKEMPLHIIRAALARNDFYRFARLKKAFPVLNSLVDFIESKDFLAGLSITFSGTAGALTHLHNQDLLEGACRLLEEIEKEIKENTFAYEGGDFQPAYIHEVFQNKWIKLRKGDVRADGQLEFVTGQPWYVFDANYGTSEEKSLVEFLARQINEMSQDYQEIYLIRNELHFKIHNFKDGQAFAPDFILFLIQKDGRQLIYQIFIEAKGGQFKDAQDQFDQGKEGWKLQFLKDIQKKFQGQILQRDHQKYRLTAVPCFYQHENENEFKENLLRENF